MNSINNYINFYKEYKRKKNQELELLKTFDKELEKYNSMAPDDRKAKQEFLYPCLYDKTIQTKIEPVYFYQDAWAFERIVASKPTAHIDIGSHHKFVAFLSKVVNLTMVDLRPLSLKMDSINFIEGDILNLPFANESISSLSSLCVIEHIGLGRYGDRLDPNGSENALKEITRVMKKAGKLYISVPVSDKSITAFNAGRIFEIGSFLSSIEANYIISDKKFIVGSTLQETFEADDRFGSTILLEMIKR